MKLYASGEDYLEAILMIQKEKGMARSVDVARHLGFSKPSVSHAVGILREGGFLTVDADGFLHLTETGREVAEKIYDRHQLFAKMLMDVGIEAVVAEQEACKMEHTVSQESFEKIREAHRRYYDDCPAELSKQ